MIKDFFKNIRDYFTQKKEYRNAKKTLTLATMNQYYDFLVAETEAKEAEKKAYESMIVFSENFTVEDFQGILSSINKIAGSPDLQTSFYENISKQAHKEKMNELKAMK